MSGEQRFGKCDECGVIGPLIAVAPPEKDRSAHFCASCHRIFGAHPELSSLIAFQRSKVPGKRTDRVEIPLSYGPGHGEDPGVRGGAIFAVEKTGEHRNLHGIQEGETRRRDDE